MVTLQQISYYPPPPPLPPQYEDEAKRAIYEEKIKSKIETAKRNNKYWLLLSVFWGVSGVFLIILAYYTGKLFPLSEIPLGMLFLILCLLYFHLYITKRGIKNWEKCLSPRSAINFYKKQIKKMFLIAVVGAVVGMITTILYFGYFQYLATQKSLLYQLIIIGITMIIMVVALPFYFLIKIKECEKYI